ncbi:formylglycine-generating enzyme family protein [Echinicola sp. CAU 1574]|uniref:Formylglycine-generating enzyme family protein n=1 Tax=Echinicola arenosa TaxID=2774144 RepID=A0ABR9ANN3_9BACT|nr:formylglycine-generating enzyme family protein [Echinicola arenosa]MBD8489229.1 formylglycine-generating enzyme family protein [Echinicola arenosa]
MLLNKFAVALVLAGGILPSQDKANINSVDFKAYQQEIPNTNLSFELTPIPAGEFLMGSPEAEKGRESDEGPQRKVALDAFWMGKHEITWDIFELFLNKNYEASVSEKALSPEVDGLTRPSTPYLDMTFGMGKENMPAVGMTQYGAIQFCKWLYTKTGVFYRLPTEAEWEYAAKAGSESAYFFGDDGSQLKEYAWYEENSEETTHEIGQKKPNPWDLYDIYGNVLEWTNDAYVPSYPSSNGLDKNPVQTTEELYPRAIRGGSFVSEADELRSSKRFYSTPDWKQIDPQIPKSQWWFPEAPFLGIRVVRPLVTPSEEEIMAYYNQAPIDDY